MKKERAVSAVKTILKAASYDVEEGNGGIDLNAYRGCECLVVLCSDDSSDIDFFLSKKFRVQLEDGVSDCKKLLFTMKNVGSVENCTVWGHMELAKYSGQATVADVLGESLALDFKDNSTGYIRNTENYNKEPSKDLGPELACLPSVISEERARQIAGVKGDLHRVYIPHYLYVCESTGEKIFKNHVIDFNFMEKGLINAISGNGTDIDPEDLLRLVPEKKNVPGDAKVLDAKLKKPALRDLLMDKIVESLTKSVRVSTSEGDTISYEDIRVTPDKDNIKIELELVYLPVIQIRGNKIVEVEAFTGEILREPLDDGVELL
ncbi:MAG: hypothetical protein JXQ82_07505 [Methanomicrobiaceae archaeon]|nr:hypothetical protein [Methanomicrobiaceae archaeon]